MQCLLTILVIFLFVSCSKGVEKPAVTIAQHSKQVYQITEVVNKLLSEPNIKTMNLMADGVEATRAINCDSVGEECNAYYEFVNKVVDVTKDGNLTDADRKILLDLQKKLNVEISKSNIKIQNDWKNYINAEKRAD